MRIIAGKYKSRLIKAPDTITTRPSMDKTREAIFNVLNFYLPNAKVLDLFAGSGALGIEAISRGASFVTFIDNNPKAIKTIKDNLKELNITSDFNIYQKDYKILETINDSYDLIFLDPPYEFNKFEEILDIITNNNLLNDHGVIIYESNKENKITEIDNFILKQKRYGIAYVSFLYKIDKKD